MKLETPGGLLTIEKPNEFEYLIKIAEEKGLRDIPIPIEFAKEVLSLLRSPLAKYSFP